MLSSPIGDRFDGLPFENGVLDVLSTDLSPDELKEVKSVAVEHPVCFESKILSVTQ